MTDLDVNCRRAARGWYRVAMALRDRTSPKVSGPIISKALAKHLRDHGGLASLPLAVRVTTGSSPTHAEVVQAMHRVVRQLCADRVLPRFVTDGVYDTMADAFEHLRGCLGSSGLDQLAERVIRDPRGVRVRAPAVRHQPLYELLDEPAPTGLRA